MTHRRKKPGSNVIVHSNEGMTEQNQESFGTEILNRARSVLDTVQSHITEHYALYAGIGLAGGAAFYLFGTDQGRSVRNRILDTAGDSYTTVKDNVVQQFGKLKDVTTDVVNKTILQQDTGQREQMRRAG